MLAQYLRNHFNNKGEINNHSINACVPFWKAELSRFGEVTVENNTEIPDLKEDVEVAMIAWICARFLKCVLNQKRLKAAMAGDRQEMNLFDIATFDDIAFLMLLFEDGFDVWLSKATELVRQEQKEWPSQDNNNFGPPPKKRLCRDQYKTCKTFGTGNGLSGKFAQL